jgi:osmotically-inducible protein OsmY
MVCAGLLTFRALEPGFSIQQVTSKGGIFMASRYDNRSYSRGEGQFGRDSESNYGRSYGDQSQKRYRYDDDDDETYNRENRLSSNYSDRYGSSGRGYERDRENYGRRSTGERDYSDRDRNYGGYGDENRYGRMSSGYSSERDRYGNYGDESRYNRTSGGPGEEWSSGRYGNESRYGQSSGSYSQRYNYPTGFRSGQSYGGSSYGQTGRGYGYRSGDYGYGSDYGEGYAGGRYEDERYGRGGERGWWDRTSDEISSWFGDQEAERRRQMDRQRAELRGRGPKNYRRSDERIKEDVNDRLGDGYLDATEIEVQVANGDVTLTGMVKNRIDKRRAEDIAESVSGVSNVENRLRVKESSLTRNTEFGSSSSTGTTGTTGTTDTSTSATSTGTTSRGRSAGS